jgi:hypothetical protein
MPRSAPLALGVLLVLPFLAAPPAAATVDPWAPGPYAGVRQEYDFGPVLVTNPATGARYPVELAGSVHFPAAGDGPFPLVLFMHGRHGTCRAAGVEVIGTGVCPATAITTPVDSYKGYDYVSDILVTHGYVVVSVNVNGINDRDLLDDYGMHERAEVVLWTLDAFTGLNATAGAAPIGGALVGRIDLSRIGLMGHSRGGEGVAKAITMNAARTDGPRHAIRSVFALAPVDFFRQVPVGVTFATLLPYCDGDVYNLQGGWMYDDLRYAAGAGQAHMVLALGANHNFYNTVWTADDNGGSSDPYCGARGSGRFSPADQQRHGLVLVAGFFRHTLGGEPGMEDLFTGAASMPPAGCPAAAPACPDRFHVSWHAPAGERLVLEDTRETTLPSVNDAGGANVYANFTLARSCAPSSCPTSPNDAAAQQLALTWTRNATWRLEIPAGAGDVASFTVLGLRVGVDYSDTRNPAGKPQDLRVVLTDGAGHAASATLGDHSRAFFSPPGAGDRKVTLNQARIPLGAFAGVDLTDVRSVDLVFDRTPSGVVQVTDVLFE